jgi:PIN domain nuclease of toxin-antitoxin system
VSIADPPAKLLLDTCAIIWLVNADEMRPEAVAAIEQAGRSGGVLVSAASAWEVGLLSRPNPRRTLDFRPDPKSWFARLLAMPGIQETPITSPIAIAASHLPGASPADPMDRLIVATARHLCLPIVTRDHSMVAYAQAGHITVLPC